MTDQHETITVPRPKPDEAAIAITDADGASAWVMCRKTDLADGAFLAQVPLILADGQRLVHEQRKAVASQ